MDSREVGDLLEECARALTVFQKPTEAERLHYCSCKDSLCSELASLLKEAVDMKWPFVPEKWQYKQSVSADDKTNLSDLISKHLSQLLALLKASILAQEACTALAVVFLVDRFLYWIDESGRLLKITKLLHRHHPRTPVAPQLVLRQARFYLNSEMDTYDHHEHLPYTGKLQKAEYILSSLINYSGATGCWAYHSECDRALVQAVSVQVRGMSLQKLGLWLQAAELIWASLVGFYALPQPDKKGIGTSLGILANILVSMNDEDFHTFSSSPDIDLSLLGDRRHRLLSAAQAAKMAVVYSQYTSLYVLTNVVTQGTCLLSYSFSVQCPVSQRQPFLLQARETFSIGLLTKAQGQLVRSKQELHTFLKAAYSLTVTHKWLGTSREAVAQATQACQKALATFYEYCNVDTHDKDGLCAEIMHWVAQVKLLLQVEPFPNSDIGSFIPDSFKVLKDTSVNFTLEGFAKVMQRFQKYHVSLCETTNTNCKGDHIDGTRLCITALGTTVGTLNTECRTEACKVSKGTTEGQEPQQRVSKYSSDVRPPQHSDLCTTLGSTDVLGSSWDKFSLSSSGNIAMEREANASDRSCLTTGFDGGKSNGMLQSADKNKKRESQGCNSGAGSHIDLRNAMPATSSSNASSHSEKFELIQAAIETLATEDNWMADIVGVPREPSTAEEAVQSLSQLNLKTSSSSLGDSFGSQSSWEKISADPNSPTITKPQPSLLLKAGTNQSSKSPDGCFFLMETLASETPDSAHDPTQQNHTIGLDVIDSRPGPLESLNVDPDMQTKGNSVRVEHVNKKPSATPHQKRTSIENSMESSFEMLEECQNGHQRDEVTSNEKVTPSCYSCQKRSIFVPERQYLLTQQDYQALLAGVCHDCLLRRLQSDETEFKLKKHRTAYSALHLKFSKATGLWTARETCVYIGEPMGMEGKQRMAIWVQFLHQEERLSSYVGKDYLKPKKIQFHLKDVERQMTAQHYVTEFNKSLYDKEVMAQIFFIPSEALLILNGDEIVGCVTVEPYMLGDFVKLTNNTGKKDSSFQATEYGLAFGHFTYLFSDCKEVVVDLQGWVTANGKGLMYLTDPQIHSTKTPKGASNFAARGLRYFLEEQHGPECNAICQLLKLPPVERKSHDLL